jgi:hypothetical protein
MNFAGQNWTVFGNTLADLARAFLLLPDDIAIPRNMPLEPYAAVIMTAFEIKGEQHGE